MKSEIVSITNDVKWIGIKDPDLVTFDIVMETRYGTTYNSYFINASKKTIIDTAKDKYKDDYLTKVTSVVKPNEIEYIITNHTEPDHSGSIKYLLKIAPQATVVGSGQALNYLSDMLDEPFKSLQVRDGDILDLGSKKIRFIGASNLHWPDSIYTYLEEDKILFTCDSFGAHFCHDALFDDLVGDYQQAFKYYFDVILKPYSKFMLKAIEKIRLLNINCICPGHGPILRSTWKQVVDLTAKLSEEYIASLSHDNKNVLIAYVSAYGYTREMAKYIADGIKLSSHFNVDLTDIEHILLGELEEKIVRSDAIIIGSPTIIQNILMQVYKMFALINPIRDRGKLAAAFGSYGWSGEAVGIIQNHLKQLKLNVMEVDMKAKFFPYNEKAIQLIEFGKNIADQLKQNQNSVK